MAGPQRPGPLPFSTAETIRAAAEKNCWKAYSLPKLIGQLWGGRAGGNVLRRQVKGSTRMMEVEKVLTLAEPLAAGQTLYRSIRPAASQGARPAGAAYAEIENEMVKISFTTI